MVVPSATGSVSFSVLIGSLVFIGSSLTFAGSPSAYRGPPRRYNFDSRIVSAGRVVDFLVRLRVELDSRPTSQLPFEDPVLAAAPGGGLGSRDHAGSIFQRTLLPGA